MRAVVVGATGNIGTAVLRALQETSEVTSILGLARRAPDTSVAPYRACEWRTVDLAGAEDRTHESLVEAFAGAEVVVHLAWLIQPNSERELLRRVNVDGTARVVRAAVAAGVPRLVVASSVGAYSPDGSGTPRDEDWPSDGIPTAHYSVDKAAQERVLDDAAAAHPELRIARIRPALVFQSAAASEVQRLFLGGWASALRRLTPPLLPVPRDLRSIQAVHADDLGPAFASAAVRGASGAYNICADDALRPEDLAGIVDHGRILRLPTPAVRAALAVAHRFGVVAADPGWLDMAVSAPTMSNDRARHELDWSPRITAADALRELVDGIRSGAGGGSAPLQPRRPGTEHLPEPCRRILSRASATSPATPDNDGAAVSRDLLGIYLADHLAGATAGAGRAERMSSDYADTPLYAPLSETAREIRLEREFLRRFIEALGLPRRRHRQAALWAGERMGRLKSNGTVVRRSPLTLLLEAELMRTAVIGKLGMWQSLRSSAGALGLDPDDFAELEARAEHHAAIYGEVHAYARERTFRTDRDPFRPGRDAGGATPLPGPEARPSVDSSPPRP